MRVCHLIDTEALDQRPATAALLAELIARDRSVEHVVWTMGPGDAHRNESADEAWPTLRAVHHARIGRRLPWLGARALGGLSGFDAVCAWSMAASAMTGAAGDAKRFVVAAEAVDAAALPRWVATAQRRRPAQVIAMSGAAADAMRDQRLAGDGLRTIDPGVDASRIERAARRELRLRLGVGDERTWLVAAMDSPPGAVDALTAMLAVGLAAETGRPMRLLLGPTARGLQRAMRVTEAAGRPGNLIVDGAADRPWVAGAAADAALVSGPGLGVAWAMAAGLAIVTGGGGGGLTHRATVSVARTGRAGALAQRLCQSFDDGDGTAERAAAARRDAAARFDADRFADELGAILADRGRVACEPVAWPARSAAG